MMGFYDSLAKTSIRLIAEKGRTVSVIYKEPGTYDPANDSVVEANLKRTDVAALITNYKESNIDGTLIRLGDKKATIAAKNFDKPRVGDLLVDNENEYTIKYVDEIGPGDTPLIFQLHLRK